MDIFKSEVRLGSSRSLITGNTPVNLTLEQVQIVLAASKTADSRLGLFETGAPNYNTFYPDVDVADVTTIKDQDYIQPLFRALSKTVVNKYGPIDFSSGNVLKDSMEKLYGMAIMPNHEAIVGQELGSVSEIIWQETSSRGSIEVPPGINARIKLDVKSHPTIARNILMTPPAIHSTSVTVVYLWEKSHPDLSDSEFYSQLGAYDKDGELVRAVVKEIKYYKELSLVPHGADVFAQKIGEDGVIVNPDLAENRSQFNAGRESLPDFYFIDYSDISQYTGTLSLSALSEEDKKQATILNDVIKQKQLMDKDKLIQTLGLSENATDAEIDAALNSTVENAKKFEEQEKSGDNGEGEEGAEGGDGSSQLKDTKTGEPSTQGEGQEAFFEILKCEREDAVAAYRLAKGDDARDQTVKTIMGMSFRDARNAKEEYNAEAKKNLGNGGSSSKRNPENEDGKDGGQQEEPTNVSMQDAVETIRAGKTTGSMLYSHSDKNN